MKLYTLALIILLPVLGFAQYDFKEAYFYPEAMQEDLDQLVAVIKEVHPAPWRYISEGEFDALVNQVRRELNTSCSIYKYMDKLQELLSAIGDSHSTLELPIELAFRVNSEVPLIPIKVHIEDDQLFLTDELKAFRTLEEGVEILSINDIRASVIIEKMRSAISVDGANTSYADFLIANNFPLLFHRAVLRDAVFSVRYRTKGGMEKLVELKSLTRNEMELTGKSPDLVRKSLQWTKEAVDGGKYVWLRIPTLSRTAIASEGIRPDRILKDTQKLLRNEKAQILIIDLRGASGMEIHLSKKIYQLFATDPFRSLSNMMVSSFEMPVGIDPDGFPESGLQELQGRCIQQGGHYVLDEKDEVLQLISPRKDSFKGKVLIITDGGTIEAGTVLAAMVKRDGRGMVVGNETGSNGSSFCGGEGLSFTGKRTSVRFSISLVQYELDNGSYPVMAHGIKPDLPMYFHVQDHAEAAIERDLFMFIREWE